MKRKIYENKLLMEQFTSTITKKPESWEIATLGDYLELLTDYHANGSYEILKANVKLLYEEDYAVMIRTTNFEQSNFENLVYINKKAYDFLSKSKVFTGDILMNKIANAGAVYTMPDLKKPVSLGMNLFLLRFDKKYCDHYYIYSYLNYPPIRYLISNMTRGASTRTITKDMVRNIPLVLPPLSEQKKIASVLSAYDDLIELNERRIKILEEMAKLFYKDWFVKFRFPGYEKGKMTESGLGIIPEGWEVRSILDIEAVNLIKAEVKRYDGVKEYFATANVEGNNIIKDGEMVTYDERPSRAQMQPEKNTIWFAKMRETFKVLCFTSVNKEITEKSILSSGFAGFKVDKDKIGFFYFTICSERFHALKDQYCTGATQMSSTIEGLSLIKIILPEENLIKKYNNISLPVINQIILLQQQNRNLRQTRDMLLPKVISGEVKIRL